MADLDGGILSQAVRSILASSPYLLLLTVGLLLAIVRGKVHPLVSLLAGLGFGLHITVIVGSSFFYAWVMESKHDPWNPDTLTWWYFGAHLVSSILHAVAGGLILVAVFGWRFPPEPPAPSQRQP